MYTISASFCILPTLTSRFGACFERPRFVAVRGTTHDAQGILKDDGLQGVCPVGESVRSAPFHDEVSNYLVGELL